MFTDEEMLQITNAINCGLKEFRGEFAEFKSEVYRRFDEQDRKFEAINKRFEGIDKRFEAIDKRFEAIDKRFEAIDKRFKAIDKKFEVIDKRLDELAVSINELKTHVVRDELILKEVLDMVNSSYGKYARSSNKVEWCDMQIRIIGNVVSEHSEKIARVEEKIAEYEAGNEQRGDSIPSGKNKKRG